MPADAGRYYGCNPLLFKHLHQHDPVEIPNFGPKAAQGCPILERCAREADCRKAWHKSQACHCSPPGYALAPAPRHEKTRRLTIRLTRVGLAPPVVTHLARRKRPCECCRGPTHILRS